MRDVIRVFSLVGSLLAFCIALHYITDAGLHTVRVTCHVVGEEVIYPPKFCGCGFTVQWNERNSNITHEEFVYVYAKEAFCASFFCVSKCFPETGICSKIEPGVALSCAYDERFPGHILNDKTVSWNIYVAFLVFCVIFCYWICALFACWFGEVPRELQRRERRPRQHHQRQNSNNNHGADNNDSNNGADNDNDNHNIPPIQNNNNNNMMNRDQHFVLVRLG